jgi:sugar-specific transcriptional regulator TrmB
MSDIGADKLAKIFLKMRDELQRMEREHEEKVAELKSQMEVIESEMLNVCKETGADSLKTPYGTIIKSTKTRYWTSDWESMHRFIEDHKAFDLLERRVHQTNMKAWIEDNPDFLPQGLNAESRYSVTVRRSK